VPKVNAKQKDFHKRTEADIHALLAAYDDDIAFGGGLYLRMQGGAARWFAVYRRRKQDDGKKVRHPLGTVEERQSCTPCARKLRKSARRRGPATIPTHQTGKRPSRPSASMPPPSWINTCRP
jgi:hypothetical protein